jgi:hypothetical protein
MWHSCFGEIEVVEQVYRFNDKAGSRIRPFSDTAQVHSHSYSKPLQRVVSDFGADNAFGQVNKKLKEHYKITLPMRAASTITEFHAQRIAAHKDLLCKESSAQADTVIAESDGSMVPIVETYVPETSKKPKDRRKNKKLSWKEARLSLAHAKGSTCPCFAGTMESVEVAGEQLLACANQAGAHKDTHVHCVGDGARWIANQVEEQFGANGTYLIDFYHLCEYLSAAAASCCGQESEASWLDKQKKEMKASNHKAVLIELKPYLEEQTVDDSNAPVRACYRYIDNRPAQLDYKTAIERDLPIGSGEVESAHRYVLQARLKIAGAWWKLDNAKNMIELRVCRANDLWSEYWDKAA